MPNQMHRCTVWLIQYSHAVDYHCIKYTAHYFCFDPPMQSTIYFPSCTLHGVMLRAIISMDKQHKMIHREQLCT